MNTDFAIHLSKFLGNYLPEIKGVSSNTISSYRDTFRLFLEYCQKCENLPPEKIVLSDISENLIVRFLAWIENERGCSPSTRNQRMAALHSFFRYVQIYIPERMCEIQKILAIPPKKTAQVERCFVSFEDMKRILELPDISSPKGRRDRMILCLLYDTGARVSELINIRYDP